MDVEKIFFQPGDVVTINKNIPNKPVMYIVKKKTLTFRPEDKNDRKEFFQGMLCRWFTSNGEMQEATFSTKDLIKQK